MKRRTVLVMYFDNRVIARHASAVVVTTRRSISSRTIEPDWQDLIRARRRLKEGLKRNTARQLPPGLINQEEGNVLAAL